MTTMLRDEPIHTAVELRIDKAPFDKELIHERAAPVAATTRPLDEDTSADAESVISHAHEALPKALHVLPVLVDLANRGGST